MTTQHNNEPFIFRLAEQKTLKYIIQNITLITSQTKNFDKCLQKIQQQHTTQTQGCGVCDNLEEERRRM